MATSLIYTMFNKPTKLPAIPQDDETNPIDHLRNVPDPNQKNHSNDENLTFPELYLQETSLHEAVRRNDETRVLDLLQKGEDPNKLDYRNCTPVHVAVRFGHEKLLKHLVKFGGDINRLGGRGHLPLQMVPSSKNQDFLNAVLDCKPEINKKDASGTPTLIFYVKEYPSRLLDILKLLEYGSDPNLTDQYGWNSLHHLTTNWSISKSGLARALISYGIELEALTPNNNLSALQLAYCRYNCSFLMHILLRSGAKLRTDWGETKPFDWKGLSNVATLFTHGLIRNMYYYDLKRVANVRINCGHRMSLLEKCEYQLELMRYYRIRGLTITYYRFLMLSTEECSKLIVDEQLRYQIKKSFVYFPLYSDFFLDKMYAGIQWRKDNDNAALFLSNSFNVPLEISEKILGYFSSDELALLHRSLRIL